jgi:hypothetical protein
MFQIRAKAAQHFTNLSIPGTRQIVIIEKLPLKMIWTTLILIIFALGIHNVSRAVTDFYKFDKISNIKRVSPENVTFPSITICAFGHFQRFYKNNGSIVMSDDIWVANGNVSRIKKFIFSEPYFANLCELVFVPSHLDFL